ncbi:MULTISPECIES: hypothetical protein [Bacillaceae]|uniref:Uncharacterized protein n=1 Tax=Evansella alkalicola TaxID=745819 RepID=A0ABS6JTQ1_9BACI|nr:MULTISPECIES: hypothetical protein [Bacillaceae]MBU9721961.1 hypothetical protein [Bacillus alkalicola]
MEGKLYFLNYVELGRPIDENYVAEIDDVPNSRKSFGDKADALLYLNDNGVKTYKYLTKEASEYKSLKNLLDFEFWRIKHRVGYVSYHYEFYEGQNGEVKKRRAYVFRFVGFGRSCFAETKEELTEIVLEIIAEHLADPRERGLNTFPYFTKYYRKEHVL